MPYTQERYWKARENFHYEKDNQTCPGSASRLD
jgi:hypothetical protein